MSLVSSRLKKNISVKEAEKLGKRGDTILAHINPEEAEILKSRGGVGTINPDTGLPQFYGSDSDGSETGSNPEGPGPDGGGTGTAGQADADSHSEAVATKAAADVAVADAFANTPGLKSLTDTKSIADVDDESVNQTYAPPEAPKQEQKSTTNPTSIKAADLYTDNRSWVEKGWNEVQQTWANLNDPNMRAQNEVTGLKAAVNTMFGIPGLVDVMQGVAKAAGQGITAGIEGMFGVKGEAPEQANDTGHAGQGNADGGVGDRTNDNEIVNFGGRQYKMTWQFDPRIGQMVPQYIPVLAKGGQIPFAQFNSMQPFVGGGPVEGPGDGVEDKIPAMLSDGEFVIPARHVSALGNGSNKAGASRLYGLLKNIEHSAKIDKDAKIKGINALLPKG